LGGEGTARLPDVEKGEAREKAAAATTSTLGQCLTVLKVLVTFAQCNTPCNIIEICKK